MAAMLIINCNVPYHFQEVSGLLQCGMTLQPRLQAVTKTTVATFVRRIPLGDTGRHMSRLGNQELSGSAYAFNLPAKYHVFNFSRNKCGEAGVCSTVPNMVPPQVFSRDDSKNETA